jgi:hypothetical protein
MVASGRHEDFSQSRFFPVTRPARRSLSTAKGPSALAWRCVLTPDPSSFPSSYIPAPDDRAITWLERFHNVAKVKPSAFGFDDRDIATLGRLIVDFRDKHAAAACIDTGSMSLAKVAATIAARDAVVQTIDRLVKVLHDNPLTTDDDLQALGLPSHPPRSP